MSEELEAYKAIAPSVETALGQIEEWVAILAAEIGVAGTAKLLRRIAVEVEGLPTGLVQ